MDKTIAGLLGAVAALTALDAAQASPAPAQDALRVTPRGQSRKLPAM